MPAPRDSPADKARGRILGVMKALGIRFSQHDEEWEWDG
jgi:hypothetical protein